MRISMLILIHLFAALVPIYSESEPDVPAQGDASDWPREIGGLALEQVSLSPEEQAFYRGFPGQIARFTAGEQEIVIRKITRASRKLHPTSDCLRGSGYRVSPQPAWRDAAGQFWGCVVAEKAGRKMRVCERIEDSEGRGWYDVSSWYWAALSGSSKGPWQAVTIAEAISGRTQNSMVR